MLVTHAINIIYKLLSFFVNNKYGLDARDKCPTQVRK